MAVVGAGKAAGLVGLAEVLDVFEDEVLGCDGDEAGDDNAANLGTEDGSVEKSVYNFSFTLVGEKLEREEVAVTPGRWKERSWGQCGLGSTPAPEPLFRRIKTSTPEQTITKHRQMSP